MTSRVSCQETEHLLVSPDTHGVIRVTELTKNKRKQMLDYDQICITKPRIYHVFHGQNSLDQLYPGIYECRSDEWLHFTAGRACDCPRWEVCKPATRMAAKIVLKVLALIKHTQR